ncbi:MAG: hypothetical protein QW247_07695 [Pyrobaculum sp.]
MNVLWYDNTDLAISGSGQQAKTTSLLRILSRFIHIILLHPCRSRENLDLSSIDIIDICDIKGVGAFSQVV